MRPRALVRTALAAAIGSLLLAAPARAELLFGTGAFSNAGRPAWEAQLGSSIPLKEPRGLVFARLEGEILIQPPTYPVVPHLRIQFAPAEFQVYNTEWERQYSPIDLYDVYEYRALPVAFGRDIQLGRRFDFQTFVIGMHRVRLLNQDTANLPMYRVHLRALGYHRISFTEDVPAYNGIELIDLLVQAGIARRLGTDWLMLLSGTLETEVSIRPRLSGQQWEVRIDPSLRLDARYRRLLQVFVEARYALAHDPSVTDTFRSVGRIGGGVVLRFR